MRVRKLFCLILVLLLSLFMVPRAVAHGRTPRLEISSERMNPGGVLDIRGVEFDYEEVIALYLERQGLVIELGQIVADLEGIFIHTIVLPPDLPIGTYTIRGVTEHHDVLSPVLTVQGPAILSEGGGQGERDEDDGLLAPMPTHAAGVVPGSVSPTAAESILQSAPASNRSLMVFSLLILLGGGILVISRSIDVRKR